jgi:dihydroorotate dehydrogenase (NAD+) catalytic subunit
MNADDAIQYILAGASLVSIGTANMINPCSALDVKNGLIKFMEEKGFSSIKELTGIIHN